MRAGRALRDQWADERFARDNPGVSPTIRHPLTCPPCGTEAKVGTRAVRFTATGETVTWECSVCGAGGVYHDTGGPDGGHYLEVLQ